MNTLETALLWHSLGIATIPILAGSKKPALAWEEFQRRLPTERELRGWFSTEYNIALVLGWRGLVVIDFDSMLIFSQWMAGLKQNVAEVLSTYRVRTARGVHLYFYVDEPTETTKLEGIDIKAAASYVLTDPSRHPSGSLYVGCGDPRRISHIQNLRGLLGEWWREPAPVAPRVCRATVGNPYADAWREPVELNGLRAEDIVARVDLLELARQAGAQLRQQGRRWFSACPLHGGDCETAFVIQEHDGRQMWHCWTNCPPPPYGDVIEFVARWKGIDKGQAMMELARKF
jgi:hypothetical protein